MSFGDNTDELFALFETQEQEEVIENTNEGEHTEPNAKRIKKNGEVEDSFSEQVSQRFYFRFKLKLQMETL